MGGKCRFSLHWEGSLEFVLEPRTSPQGWVVQFTVVDSFLYGKDRQPAFLVTRIWNMVKGNVHPGIEAVTVDFGFPLEETKAFVLSMLSPETREIVRKWLDGARPGILAVTRHRMVFPIRIEVDPAELEKEEPPEAPLTPEEVDRAVRGWETWDAFLVYEIVQLAESDLSMEERELLGSVLLDLRHEFVRTLVTAGDKGAKDLTRTQFMTAWTRLSPIFKKYFVRRKGGALRILALLSAQDALNTLDRLGPSLGVEISRDGLLRLGRLLAEEGTPPPTLAYDYEVSLPLQRILKMGENLPEPNPPPAGLEEGLDDPDLDREKFASLLVRFLNRFVPSAWAVQAPEGIEPWLPKRNPPDEYLARVRDALDSVTRKTFDQGAVNPSLHGFFQEMVLATAWQESCWRQFIERKGKVGYLVSYNNTSVGLMQINERVWRGIYKVEGIRWSPEYNAGAGAEILAQYLRRYALGKKPAPENNDVLAGVLYAMYNSGPGDYRKYFKRREENKFYKSDNLFREKWDWVHQDQWAPLRRCIGYP
jgi:hypothetical protein